MPNHSDKVADSVVSQFKEKLGDELSQQIGDSHFYELTLSIKQSLDHETNRSADAIAELARTMRVVVDKPTIEL